MIESLLLYAEITMWCWRFVTSLWWSRQMFKLLRGRRASLRVARLLSLSGQASAPRRLSPAAFTCHPTARFHLLPCHAMTSGSRPSCSNLTLVFRAFFRRIFVRDAHNPQHLALDRRSHSDTP